MINSKHIYVWDIPSICGGDVSRIAAMIREAGFEAVILHDARLENWRTALRANLIKALRAEGIEVIGGAAVYGANPTLEGQQAASICNTYGLKAFVFDAESAWDAKDAPDSNAVKLLQAFRKVAPDAKTGWCYWSFWHSPSGLSWAPRKKVIWAAQAPNYGDCDYLLPMMYWQGSSASEAVDYLQRSWAQYREITTKPIVPLGRAYNGDGGAAIPAAVTAFDTRARSLGAAGMGWWSMQHALNLAGVWEALAMTRKFADTGASTPITIEQRLDRLEQAVFGRSNA